MSAEGPSIDELAEATARRIRAAIASVKDEVRRLPQAQAETRLSAVLGDDRRVLGSRGVKQVVRHIQDPWWSVKHPLLALREARRR